MYLKLYHSASLLIAGALIMNNEVSAIALTPASTEMEAQPQVLSQNYSELDLDTDIYASAAPMTYADALRNKSKDAKPNPGKPAKKVDPNMSVTKPLTAK